LCKTARKSIPATNLNELIAWLKTNSGKTSAGIAVASGHLMTAVFQKEINTQFTLVSYCGNAPALQDLVAGQIDLLFSPTDALPLVRAGDIKAFARFLSGDYAEALAAADKVKPLLSTAAAQIQLLDYFYYAALTVAALYERLLTTSRTGGVNS
jgi:hypothetical protein